MSEANPQEFAIWEPTPFDPSHPKINLWQSTRVSAKRQKWIAAVWAEATARRWFFSLTVFMSSEERR